MPPSARSGGTLHLGHGRDGAGSDVRLPTTAMLRHVMALGSSGSGKTVLCKVLVEEIARAGIPVICVDPQGDLCSLALSDDAQWTAHTDVVVFTPASRKGVALCADPLDGGGPDSDGPAANAVVSLLGYDLDSDDGDGLRAVVESALADRRAAGAPAASLAELADYLAGLRGEALAPYERFLDARKLRTACQRLARLDVGARRRLFHDGLSIDIDALLGRGAGAPAGKTRVSVVYLNTLHSQEDKDFFVAALADRLYAWMLRNPSDRVQALFYIDEVAPFVPPVRKPACKNSLQLLFKQARKYGIACLMATQNPGDVDYKAMAQFGTWALGRLTTRQDIKKIEPTVKSLAPDSSDTIVASLPSLKPGEFVLLSPDHLERPTDLHTRWLITEHQTLDENRIEALADERWRRRFPLPAAAAPGRAPRRGRPVEAPAPPAIPPAPPAATPAPSPPAAPERSTPSRPAPSRAEARVAELEAICDALGTALSMTAPELAKACGFGAAKARRALAELVEADLARVYKDGRVNRYWAVHTGARPDLGLGRTVPVVVAQIDRARAEQVAAEMARTKLLGLLGDEEQLRSAELVHRPVYQVVFSETVARSMLKRLVGPKTDRLIGAVYIHPITLQLLSFTPKRGITFAPRPAERASDIDDFDGAARFDDQPPGTLSIDEVAWRARRPRPDVEAHFRATFDATPTEVNPMFVPVWSLMLRPEGGGNYRAVTIDALVGRPVEWP